MFPGPYTLYGSKRSFFTEKVENVLRYLDLPYELHEKWDGGGAARTDGDPGSGGGLRDAARAAVA